MEDAFAKRKKWELEMANSEILDVKMLQHRGPSIPTLEPQVDSMTKSFPGLFCSYFQQYITWYLLGHIISCTFMYSGYLFKIYLAWEREKFIGLCILSSNICWSLLILAQLYFWICWHKFLLCYLLSFGISRYFLTILLERG